MTRCKWYVASIIGELPLPCQVSAACNFWPIFLQNPPLSQQSLDVTPWNRFRMEIVFFVFFRSLPWFLCLCAMLDVSRFFAYTILWNESLQIKSQAPNGTCCKEIWQKVGRKKCSTNKPPQSAGLKREKRKWCQRVAFRMVGMGATGWRVSSEAK